MKVLALMNQKGGVGKTTSALNCAGALVRLGKRVLVLDLDPQANLTKSFGIEAEGSKLTVFEFLKEECTFSECVKTVLGIDIMPANIGLARAELYFSAEQGREFILKDAITKYLKPYDYVLLDCPPALGFLSLNAMALATDVLIVLKTDNYSIFGTHDLTRGIDVARKRLNKKLEIIGLVATCFDSRNKLDQEALDLFQRRFPEKIFKTVIRQNIKLRESPAKHQDIFHYDPKSHGAEDYLKLTKEIIQRTH